jgi:aminoglycoside phosphotransferase (APT) family kinase protein
VSARGRVRVAGLGPRLSDRRNAEVFRLGEDRVYKRFRAHVPRARIEYELRVARAVHALGAPVPAIEDAMVEDDRGLAGLVYEYIDATPCSELFRRQPGRTAQLAQQLAAVHRQVHGLEAGEALRSQRGLLAERLLRTGTLGLRQRQRLLAVLAAGADHEPDRLCHGNFHPSNVLLRGERAWVLSWSKASSGNPCADAARTFTLLRYGDVAARALRGWFETQFAHWRARTYLRHYRAASPWTDVQFAHWQTVQLALRLDDRLGARARQVLQRALVRSEALLPAGGAA